MSNRTRFFCFAFLPLLFISGSGLLAQRVPASLVRPIPEKGFSIILGFGYFSAQEEFTDQQTRQPLFTKDRPEQDDFGIVNAFFRQPSFDFQYEYGLSDVITVGAKLSYLYNVTDYADVLVERQDIRYSSAGFSETWVWGRWGIINNAAGGLSLQLGIKPPTGDISARIPTGTGLLDYESRLMGIINLLAEKVPLYLAFDAGYRLRSGNFVNQIPFKFEFGLTASPEILIRLSLSGIQSLGTFQTPVGIRYISAQSLERRINLVGDETFYHFNLGLTAFASNNVEFYFDYSFRFLGQQTFSGEFIRGGIAIR
ncbi:MAG: hypothetical protein SFU91_07140 [Chloroherpetonaceae bacterium]|nr:hypothetical protein [Chloroherpetonaceae bacterium]